ncbi:hypothetical protein ABFS83_12G098000 [Erythranthe nasuta]
MRRELFRELALRNSPDSSLASSRSSSFSLGSASPFPNLDDQLSSPTNYLRRHDVQMDLSEMDVKFMWYTTQGNAALVRKLLQENASLVHARDYDGRTPLHVAANQGMIELANTLLDFGSNINAQDRSKKTPLDNANAAKNSQMIELLKARGGISYGFEQMTISTRPPKRFHWQIDPAELDFSESSIISRGSFGEVLKANWHGTPVAVKRIIPNLSEDRSVTHEVNLLMKLRHPNIVEFLGAVTERNPLLLITEYLRGGDLHQHLKEKGALNPSTAINFALDIARGMAYLHFGPNIVIHRDLQPRNIFLSNSSGDRLKVGDFGLSKLVRVQNSQDVYKMTGETGSYRYMAPEVFKHRKYDKKTDVFSFAIILYEMLEGEPPMANYEPYEAARYVSEGHRPAFRAKSFTPELKELTDQCWAGDMNQRPSFLEILKKLEKIKETLSSDHHWHIFAS